MFGSDASKTLPEVYGEKYSLEDTPTYTGKTLKGWYKDSVKEDKPVDLETAKVDSKEAYTIYAHWTSIVDGDVTFKVEGKEDIKIKQYSGDKYILPPDPSVEYKNFVGWYDAETGGNKITSESIVPNPLIETIYARFDNISVTVNFDPNGGKWDDGSTEPQPKSLS